MSQSNARRRAALAYQQTHGGTYTQALQAVTSPAGALYNRIGHDYAHRRRADPRIAERIWAALGDAETVLNVGAGTGSYEPRDRTVTAVEPSAVMRVQRAADAAPCVDADAAALPFDDNAFDVAMAILSDHHWADPIAGLREMRRVARRVVVFQWDTRIEPEPFWLVRDYLPEFAALAAQGPSLQERAEAIGASIAAVPVPADCRDAFFHAHWRRPRAYLDADVRRSTSVWGRLGSGVEKRIVSQLAADLDSGAWERRNADILDLDALDLGARLLEAG